MKGYKVVFSCHSALNEMPNSQAIFGAICTILLDTKGIDEFENYIQSFKENNPIFIHSSMFQNDTYPMICRNIFSSETVNDMVQKTSSIEKLHILESLKKYKHIKYMSMQIYKDYISENQFDTLRNELVNFPNTFLTDNSILQKNKNGENSISKLPTRNGFPKEGKDKTLFYVNASYYPSNTEFCIYIKANCSKEYLESIFKYINYFGIGSRRTVGFNNFEFKRIEEMQFKNNKENCLMLSRFIPAEDEFDFEHSYYLISNDNYRSSKSYANGEFNGNYVHLLEGSWMKARAVKEYYGRIIEANADGKTIYHYGIGFSV